MKTTNKINNLLGAVLSLLVTFGLTHSAAAQTQRIVFYAPVIATNVSQKTHTVYYTTNNQIMTMNVDGTDVRQLTSASENSYYPAWRPGRTHILFHRGSPSLGTGTLDIMDANGGGTFAVATAYFAGSDWSHDGKMVCYVGPRADGGGVVLWIVSVDPAAKGQKKVGTPILVRQGECYGPQFSPDDTEIAFGSGGNSHVTVLDLATGTERSFDSMPGDTPSWSPGGDQIAFTGKVTVTTTTTTNTYTELFIMNADFSGATQVTSFNSFAAVLPTWSDDGTELAFRLGSGGTWDKASIYKIALSSGAVTLLREKADHPDWAP